MHTCTYTYMYVYIVRVPSKEFWSTSSTVNVSVSSVLSKEGSVTDSGAVLSDILLNVVLTLYVCMCV